MNKFKDIRRNTFVRYGAVLLCGILLGWAIFGGGSAHDQNQDQAHNHDHNTETAAGEAPTVWTCSMHPQIRMDQPGQCPLCAMDLIPLTASGNGSEAIDDDAIQLSEEALALANIQTSVVTSQAAVKEVALYGTIQVDERLQQSQTSHVNGRIETLYISYTGETVQEGQRIARIYSPELLTAQQELLEAAKLTETQPFLLEAAREKLRLWKVSEVQINEILESGTASPYVDIRAQTTGVVTSKNVNPGDYISTGSVLYTISDLSRLWAVFDAYEADLPFLKVGDPLEYTLQSMPGKTFKGRIAFINPMLDAESRTAKIRVEIPNSNRALKPEMYATAHIKAPLKTKESGIVIPKSAVLWTGKRSIVYVKEPGTPTATFRMRKIELGPSLGDAYVVLSGLTEGEEIVTRGTFTVDASAQLEGKVSMMNHDASETDGLEQAMLKVAGNCVMCKDRIEKAAKGVPGVTSANWNVTTKIIQLNFDPEATSKAAVSKAIAAAGHETELDKASAEAYDALPECCLYKQ